MIRLAQPLPLIALTLLVACETAPADTASGDTGDTSTDTADTGSETGDTDTDTADTAEETGDTGTQADIAILGDWVDNWGGAHEVSNAAWLSYGSFYGISQYDNDAGYAIAQNGAENMYSPNLWSRFDWGWSDGELLYCQTAYDAATEADALATTAADLTSPSTGCGGFSWSILRAPFSLTDGWDDAWGGQQTIDAFTWQSGDLGFAISAVNEADQWAVAQNAHTNAWNPDLWSRFDWAWDGSGGLYYCQSAYDAATEADALATPPADGSDFDAGCVGFSWTELRSMLSVDGNWVDGWGGTQNVTAFTWTSGTSTFAISQAHDADGWVVAQNGAANDYNPGMWSRFDWTWDATSTLWYCQTAYAAATEADAVATPAADPTDPATTGCGGFSWTSMAPA